MKQILQNARTGILELVEVPAPALAPGLVLVRNAYSVLSPGTEKMAMDFARKSLLGKARSRPDLVKQVLRKLRQEGPLPTYRTVMDRLDVPQPLGYASAGIVEAVGEGVASLAPGDRVACAGAGYANHAELIVVPENLTAHVPENLGLDRATFATLGAIAMQGLRVGAPTLGEVVAVVGLGLIGQLTVQLLLANGCRVYGIDVDPKSVVQAMALGMDWSAAPGDDHDPVLARATGGHGVDLAIVTAASESSAPILLAAELCRHKGRVVAVGATAMDLDRRTFYEKELALRMSMSYGPGRYDRRYEEVGLDYPIAYVRWTEQRNLQAFVDLAARGSIDMLRLDVETVEFERATATYEALAKGERRALAAIFRYAENVDHGRSLVLPQTDDSTMMLLSYPDGSTASISYLANASTELSKERFEVHADGKSAVCDNYRGTTLPGRKKVRGMNQDKGQGEAVRVVIEAVSNRHDNARCAPIDLESIVATSLILSRERTELPT